MKHKRFWLATLSLATAACMAFELAACGEQATKGLVYTEIYGDDGNIIGYFVGVGDAYDKTEIVIPSTYNNLPVLSIGTDDETLWNLVGGNQQFESDEELVMSYHPYTFLSCYNLKRVTIPDSVTSIGWCAFESCSSLTSVTIPDSVTVIDYGAFFYCSSLTSVTIPDSVTEIGENAFNGCSSLTSITIPCSVTEIGPGTFQLCSSLTSITIPDSVTKIGNAAFMNCSSLTEIHFNGTTKQWREIEKATNWDDYTGGYTVYCTDGTLKKGEF